MNVRQSHPIEELGSRHPGRRRAAQVSELLDNLDQRFLAECLEASMRPYRSEPDSSTVVDSSLSARGAALSRSIVIRDCDRIVLDVGIFDFDSHCSAAKKRCAGHDNDRRGLRTNEPVRV